MRCLLVLMVLIVALGAVNVYAEDAPANNKEVVIFKGDDPTVDGIELDGWGSGKASKSNEKLLLGAWSIKVATQGLYAGGRIDFTRPVALFSNGIDNSRYIQFTFFFPDTRVINPAAGTNSAYDVESYIKPKANKLRFMFVSESGATVSVEEPTAAIDPDDNWMRVAVPIGKFKSIGDAKEFRLKRLLIFADVPNTTMYLGEMKLLTDNTPIRVEPLDSQTLAIMDDLFMTAVAQGGVSSLKYSWDFDKTNGLQAESTDKITHYIYTRGGEFTVTLTVSDVDGLKAPVTVTSNISIND